MRNYETFNILEKQMTGEGEQTSPKYYLKYCLFAYLLLYLLFFSILSLIFLCVSFLMEVEEWI